MIVGVSTTVSDSETRPASSADNARWQGKYNHPSLDPSDLLV
jgi:hypothetical protein